MSTVVVEPAAGDHYCEGAASLRLGEGFFRADSRPARDLGVLLLADRVAARDPQAAVAVLDGMAGCGIRPLRYGLEALAGHAGAVRFWVNDADPDRLALLQANLAPLGAAGHALSLSSQSAQRLLAHALIEAQRFDLVDLDAFGCPSALVPLALEAVRLGGLLWLTSSDGRSPTGHDRPAAVRQLGAAARAHPASWELALRLQLGVIARAAWAQGRGIEPVLSFSEGRTFRTAVRLIRRAGARAMENLGLLAHCHRCGDQQVQSLLRLGRWPACLCAGPERRLSVSGPLWIGPLQDPLTLARLLQRVADPAAAQQIGAPTLRLLQRLAADPGSCPRCWPSSVLARALGGGPPPLAALVQALQQQGHAAALSGVMPAVLRSDAPWGLILELGRTLAAAEGPLRTAK